MEVVNDFGLTYDQMLIVEKYERVMNYLYPIFQSIPNKHNVLRTIVIEHLHKFPGLIYSAAKSTQQSKLYQRFAENLMIFSRQDECEHFNQSKNH